MAELSDAARTLLGEKAPEDGEEPTGLIVTDKRGATQEPAPAEMPEHPLGAPLSVEDRTVTVAEELQPEQQEDQQADAELTDADRMLATAARHGEVVHRIQELRGIYSINGRFDDPAHSEELLALQGEQEELEKSLRGPVPDMICRTAFVVFEMPDGQVHVLTDLNQVEKMQIQQEHLATVHDQLGVAMKLEKGITAFLNAQEGLNAQMQMAQQLAAQQQAQQTATGLPPNLRPIRRH